MNEVELFLRPVLRNDILVKKMVEDSDHQKWSCPRLEGDIQQLLDRNFGSFQGIMEEIETTMRKLQEGLECFQPLEGERQEVRPDAI